MKGETFKKCDDELIFENIPKVFTLKVVVLKMIIDCNFETTDPPDAKLIFNSMDETRVLIHVCQ